MPPDWQSRAFICSVSLYMWLLHTISSKILGPKYHLQLSHFAMSLPICFKRHFWKLHIQSCDPSKTTWHIYTKFYQWVKPKNQIVSFMTKSITSLWFLSCAWLFATPWTAAHQACVHHQIVRLLKLMSIEPEMPFNHPILCFTHLLLPAITPIISLF